MCGILAIAGNIVSTIDSISPTLQLMKHRGPDGAAQWKSSSNHAWLGHCRLMINDLSQAGNQPMLLNQNLVLVCNGEIYNYKKLKTIFESEGAHFKSTSDSEIILHAYQKWGIDCIEHLDGMFGFVIWDDKRQILFAARDRVGIKPLYYHYNASGIALASESRALTSLPFINKSINQTAIGYLLTLGYIPSPYSIWEGIHKLCPGEYLTWQVKTGLKINRYWQPPIVPEGLIVSNEQWREKFESSLNKHLLSDVPISMFLSGGLDSSSIAVGLHNINAHDIEAFTISYPTSKNDERAYAEQVTNTLGIKHTISEIYTEDIWNLLDVYAKAYDEPLCYSAALSMLQICREVSEKYRVVLSGDGGDELHAGYNWYKNINQNYSILQYFKYLIRSIVYGGGNWYSFAKKSHLHQHAFNVFKRFMPYEVDKILPDIKFTDDLMLAPLKKYDSSSLPLRTALQRIDLMTFCTEAVLSKVDQASMYYSLEVRVPFLDHQLIDFCMSARPELTENKTLVKSYVKNILPAEVINHKKQGFSLRAFNNFDWHKAMDYIKCSKLYRNHIMSEDLFKYLNIRDTGKIWSLLMLATWSEVNL